MSPGKGKKRASRARIDSSSSDEDQQQATVPVAAKSSRKKTNPIWDHYTLQEGWTPKKGAAKTQYAPAVCVHCSGVIQRADGNTTNMINHLKSHHHAYVDYQKALVKNREDKVSSGTRSDAKMFVLSHT